MLRPLIARLSAAGNIFYVKGSMFDVRPIRDPLNLCGDAMRVFSGIRAYESFCLGATGWAAACSNSAPRLSAELSNTFAAGNSAGALAIYHRLLSLLAIFEGGKYVRIPEAAPAPLGQPGSAPQSPCQRLAPAERERLRRVLANLNLPLGGDACNVEGWHPHGREVRDPGGV